MDNNNDLLYWKLGQMNAARGYSAAAKGKGTGVSWSSYWATQFIEAIENDSTSPTALSAAEKSALNYFVGRLWNRNSVSENFYRPDDPSVSTLKAVYPFINSTPDAHKYNLVDARDLDAAFRLTYTAAPGHGNGTFDSESGQTANTHLVPNTTLGLNCQIIEYVISGTGLSGARSGGHQFDVTPRNANNCTYPNIAVDTDYQTATNIQPSVNRFWSFKRVEGEIETWINGIKYLTATKTASASLPINDFHIGGVNIDGSGIVGQTSSFGFVAICDSLSDDDEWYLYETVQAFKRLAGTAMPFGDTATTAVTVQDVITSGIITELKSTITEVGAFSGKTVTIPAASYPNFYMRDFYYMAQEGYMSDAELKNAYEWYKSHIDTVGENAYKVVDAIAMNGNVSINTYPLDGNAFMALMAYLYYKQSDDAAWMTTEIDYIEALLLAAPYADGLVSIAEGPVRTTWGFMEFVYFDGKPAWINCLYYDAFKKMDEACTELSISGKQFGTYAGGILSAYRTTFWDGAYLKAATGKNSAQYDINAACYAIYLGLISGTYATAIVNSLISLQSEFILNGFLRHVPSSYQHGVAALWESDNGGYDYDTYQNGGYWPISIDFFIYAIKQVNPSLANEILFKAYNNSYIHQQIEWVGVTEDAIVYPYGATAAVLHKALRESI